MSAGRDAWIRRNPGVPGQPDDRLAESAMAAGPGLGIWPLVSSHLTSFYLRLLSRLSTKFAVVGTGSARQLLIPGRVRLQPEPGLVVRARELSHGGPRCCVTSGPDPVADVDGMDGIGSISWRVRSVPTGGPRSRERSRTATICPLRATLRLPSATPFLPQTLDFAVL